MEHLFKTFQDLDVERLKEYLEKNIAAMEVKPVNKEIKAVNWYNRIYYKKRALAKS